MDNKEQTPSFEMIAAFARVEKTLEDGVSRIEGRIGALETEMKALSEASIRQDERLRSAQARLQELKPLQDKVDDLDRAKAKLLGFGIGAGGVSGGVFSYLLKYITG